MTRKETRVLQLIGWPPEMSESDFMSSFSTHEVIVDSVYFSRTSKGSRRSVFLFFKDERRATIIKQLIEANKIRFQGAVLKGLQVFYGEDLYETVFRKSPWLEPKRLTVSTTNKFKVTGWTSSEVIERDFKVLFGIYGKVENVEVFKERKYAVVTMLESSKVGEILEKSTSSSGFQLFGAVLKVEPIQIEPVIKNENSINLGHILKELEKFQSFQSKLDAIEEDLRAIKLSQQEVQRNVRTFLEFVSTFK